MVKCDGFLLRVHSFSHNRSRTDKNSNLTCVHSRTQVCLVLKILCNSDFIPRDTECFESVYKVAVNVQIVLSARVVAYTYVAEHKLRALCRIAVRVLFVYFLCDLYNSAVRKIQVFSGVLAFKIRLYKAQVNRGHLSRRCYFEHIVFGILTVCSYVVNHTVNNIEEFFLNIVRLVDYVYTLRFRKVLYYIAGL